MNSRVSALVIVVLTVGLFVGPTARAACMDDVAAAEEQAKQISDEKEKKKAKEDLRAAKAAAAKYDEAGCTAKLKEAMKRINKGSEAPGRWDVSPYFGGFDQSCRRCERDR
jgi:hypothetical protein